MKLAKLLDLESQQRYNSSATKHQQTKKAWQQGITQKSQCYFVL